MRCFGVGLLSLACLAALGRAKGGTAKGGANKTKPANKTKTEPPKEQEAATSWQVSQFESNLTVAPQGGNFVIVPKGEYSNDVQVYQCDGSPCLPSKLAASKEPANVSVDFYQGYGKFKIWIPEVPDEYKWSLGWKITLGLDPVFQQRIYKAAVNDQDVLWSITQEGELILEPSEGGQAVELEVISLKRDAFSKCAWDAEDCIEGKCCRSGGMTCYLKDLYWGMCRPTGTCTPGKDEADGQDWNCTDVGGKPDMDPLPPALSEEDKAGSSLFCFVVSTPLTYEEDLVSAQKEAGAGVFGCDESAVWTEEELQDGQSLGELAGLWAAVVADGRFRSHAWAVRVDPDCVFFPGRLRWVLSGRQEEAEHGVYMTGCSGDDSPLQVLSRRALEAFAEGSGRCGETPGRIHLQPRAPLPSQEGAMDWCLSVVLGVQRVSDRRLLLDSRCGGRDLESCAQGHVAFHPLETEDSFNRCVMGAHSATLARVAV